MNEFVLPQQLPFALDQRSAQILSLDCFDTLLWRDTHAPKDVFTTLGSPTRHQRVVAEQRARSRALIQHERAEVTLHEIYAALLPNASAAARRQAVDHEIEMEGSRCFAFAPTVALMRRARAAGLQVIVVSDTYLSADELGRLIALAAGDEVRGLIDRIFVSCEHGLSKAEGLFETVLEALGCRPENLLHIGDNPVADGDAPAKLGIPALHLRQFASEAEQRLRLEAAVAPLFAAGEGAALQVHRPAIALHAAASNDAADVLGHQVLGPVLATFADWIESEASALAERKGGRVHVMFMMRDGHLPRLVHQVVAPGRICHPIEISRFTATATSFTDEDDVLSYLETELGGEDLTVPLRQLLMSERESAELLRSLPVQDRRAALLDELRKPWRINRILRRSRAMAERLVHHVQKTVHPVAGDTLMLVDLGYNGSVQNAVEPLLRRAFDCHVAGRYLLLREQELSGYDKKGLFDQHSHDAAALEALCGNVAVLEQLCTVEQGSVIDYDADGSPVRAANAISDCQSRSRQRVQQGCVAFAQGRDGAVIRRRKVAAPAAIRSAAAVLARLMFLPLPEELRVLSEFEHDVNLGGGKHVRLFDHSVAEAGLRQRGLFYLRGAERMYLPAELRGQGMALSLSWMLQHRFGLDLRYADFCDSTIEVPVLIADGQDVLQSSVQAVPTHDGYYLAAIPVGVGQFAVGLQFGRRYQWLQIHSAEFLPVAKFLAERPDPGAAIEARPTLEGMEQIAPHLFHCGDTNAFLMAPPLVNATEPMMLTVVFRPLVERDGTDTAATEAAILEAARP